jgi:hypothetical protein
MKQSKLLIIPCLAMATALSWGVDRSSARAEEISQPTDDTGNTQSTESVPRRKRTTNAERQEAAKRLEQQRAEQLLKETTAPAPAPDQASPPVEKGGSK